MIFCYNPDFFDVEIYEDSNKTYANVIHTCYCKESTKKQEENAAKHRKKIPFVKAALDYKTTLSDLSEVPCRVQSYKNTAKNGKTNISVKITECAPNKTDDAGFIAAVPFRGSITSLEASADVQILKGVIKYVDRYEFNGEKYTQVLYLVGRMANNLPNLSGQITFSSVVMPRNTTDNADSEAQIHTTVLTLQNYDISQSVTVEDVLAAEISTAQVSFGEIMSFASQYAVEPKPRNYNNYHGKSKYNRDNREK